jgi:DNA-binding MarR family transcriptional regulator
LEFRDFMTNVSDPIYQELLAEFPASAPEGIEAALQFLKVATVCNVRRESFFNEHGLTSGRFHLLMLLRHEPGHCLSPSELARRTQVTRGTMTQFIDALEKDGVAKRVDDPNDRRAMLVQLTAKGEALLKRILPEHLKRLTRMTEILNRAERKQLLMLMEKLAEGLAEEE